MRFECTDGCLVCFASWVTITFEGCFLAVPDILGADLIARPFRWLCNSPRWWLQVGEPHPAPNFSPVSGATPTGFQRWLIVSWGCGEWGTPMAEMLWQRSCFVDAVCRSGIGWQQLPAFLWPYSFPLPIRSKGCRPCWHPYDARVCPANSVYGHGSRWELVLGFSSPYLCDFMENIRD